MAYYDLCLDDRNFEWSEFPISLLLTHAKEAFANRPIGNIIICIRRVIIVTRGILNCQLLQVVSQFIDFTLESFILSLQIDNLCSQPFDFHVFLLRAVTTAPSMIWTMLSILEQGKRLPQF